MGTRRGGGRTHRLMPHQAGRRRVRAGAAVSAALAVLSGLLAVPAARAQSPRQVTSATWVSPGYWMASGAGAVVARGGAGFYGSTAGVRLARPIVGMAATPSGRGYWLVASDGGIFTFGDAAFLGSTGAVRLNKPIVGMAATPSGRGYWLVASDGGIFTFGDAAFLGSTGALRLARPVVGMAATPSGRGYWLVASDGGIFTFGDASFHGSAAAVRPPVRATALAPTPSGHGYWVVAADGRVITFGDASFHGAPAGLALAAPVTGLAPAPDGGGYILAGGDGGAFGYGDQPYRGGGPPGTVAVVAAPPHPAARVAAFYYPWYASLTVDGEWRHWDQGGHVPPDDIGSDYYPVRGAYSSSDASVVDAQMAEMAAAGVDEVIVSWWGRGSFEDSRLALIVRLAAAHGLTVAPHIEPYAGRTAESVGEDIAYLQASYGVDEFFVYRAQDFSAQDWAPVLGGLSGVTVWAESFWDGLEAGWVQTFAAQAGFSGVYTYDPYDVQGPQMAQICGAAREHHLLCSPSVAPGFSAVRATGQTAVRSREDGATYDSMWRGALQAEPDLVTITSYNEWHEGSQIEPATAHCTATGFCYQTYDGAYGATGQEATTVYLTRTSGWVSNYRRQEAG